jgi:maltose O-acetyltransferase
MDDTRSNYQKMLAGEPFHVPDPELSALASAARARLKVLNDTPPDDFAARLAATQALVGKAEPCLILSPFFVEYGVHIEIGHMSFVNANCTFLDNNRIVLGSRVLIGTGVQLLCAGHPVDSADRYVPWPQDPDLPFRGVGIAKPITIEDDCWIGSGAIVIGGVTIGRGTTVGAGSVVTRSLPPYVMAAGNPCRVIRQLEPRPIGFQTSPGKA